MQGESTVNQRVRKLIDVMYNGNISAFCKDVNAKQSSISSIVGGRMSSPSYDLLKSITTVISGINSDWLLTGEGEMFKEKNELPKIFNEEIEGSAPYYNNLHVSAGQIDTIEVTEVASGYIKLPGISVEQFFPVIGCSMEPEIYEGDIIGVNKLDRWEILDPDKIYMIITKDERMVKRLRRDCNNRDVIWCISSNYKEFSIPVSEIINVFRVVYVSRWKRY